MTLDGNNDPNGAFIFQAPSTLTAAVNRTVTPINRASTCNIFRQVGSSATISAGSNFSGVVMAQDRSRSEAELR